MKKAKNIHFWFFLVAILFMVSALFFFNKNTTLDIQMHDTYYVIAVHYIFLGLGIMFFLVGGIYFLFKYFKKPLNLWIGIFHFVLSLLFLLSIYMVLNKESQHYYFTFFSNNISTFWAMVVRTIFIGFLIAQILFLGNLIWAFFSPKKINH